jgi:hypothetical protein
MEWCVMHEILGFILLIIGLFFAAVALLYLFIWSIHIIQRVLFFLPNRRIRKSLSDLQSKGFNADYRYVSSGNAIAVDISSRSLFLANKKASNVYSIEDVLEIKSEFTKSSGFESADIRITVRDLHNPCYEIKTEVFGVYKLKQIDSLLAVLREPTEVVNKPMEPSQGSHSTHGTPGGSARAVNSAP